MQKKRLLAMLLALSVTCSMAVTPVYAVDYDCGSHSGTGAWTSDGASTHSRACTNTNPSGDGEPEADPAFGAACVGRETQSHSFTYTNKDGESHTVSCSANCGYSVTESHDWVNDLDSSSNKSATCTEAQKIAQKCSKTGCTATRVIDGVPATGHTYDKTIASVEHKATDATCTEKATYYKSCSCGANGSETFESGEARGHNMPSEWTKFENNHVKQCRVPTCDYEIKEAHADETGDDGLCDECGYEIGHTHVAAADSSWLNGNYEGKMFHYHACTIENCDSMSADKDFCTFVSGVCTVCGRDDPNYTAPSNPSSGGSSSSSSSSSEEAKKVINIGVLDISTAAKGGTVEVELPKSETFVPEKYLEAAKENNVSITLDYGDYKWIISDIKTPKSANLKVDTDASFRVLPRVLNAIPGDNSNVIDIAHDGALGFTATLTYNVDSKNASKYVNLYYYDPTAKKLVLQGSTKIGLDGMVNLPFKHCSTYVLNITATPASATLFEDLSAGESATVVEETLPAATNAPATTNASVDTTAATDAAANPETGNSAVALLAIPAVIAAAAVVAKKRG